MQEQELQEQLNSVWNGWQIAGVLGEGSYGKVYRIKREEFGHVYESALKVISIPQSQSEVQSALAEGMNEESVRAYFYSVVTEIVEEFTLMSKLRGNTNIVSYEDHAVVSDDKRIGWDIFIRMELLTPLPDYFNNNSLSVRSIVQLGIDMCQALELCRRYNIIHRDVKPENIFVSEIGNYKLGDFGIARQMEKTSGNMSKKGTINYMAPEVYKGEKYDATVDIYSLGLVLYRFLNNNRMPFLPPYPQPLLYNDKEKANILRMGGTKLPPPCNAQGRLSEIILKACAYEAKDRFQGPEEMRNALQQVIDHSNKVVTASDFQPFSSMNEDEGNYESNITGQAIHKEDNRAAAGQNVYRKDYGVDKEQLDDMDEPVKINVQQPVKSSNKKVLIIIPVLILLAGAGFLFFNLYKHSRESEVPGLINMTLDEAAELLSGEEYMLMVASSREEYSDKIEKGRIISQNIESGTVVDKGTQLQVVISKGALCIVPKIVGMNRSEAKEAVENAGLTYKEASEEYSDMVEAGAILTQDVAENTELEEGKTVTVIVSKGKEMSVVPKVIDMTVEEAQTAFTSAGLNIEISEEYSDTVEVDRIISQDIEPGNEVDKGTTVNVVKSLGKKPVKKTTNSSGSSSRSSNKGSSTGGGEIIWDEVD